MNAGSWSRLFSDFSRLQNQKKIDLYDTTLRDGAQTEGVTFSLEDKVNIIRRLSDFNFDYIEAGFPSSNSRDRKVLSKIKNLGINSRIAAFGMTSANPGKKAEIKELLDTEAGVLTVFGKSWDIHARDVLGISLDENLEMISATVDYLKSHGFEVFYDAEHFFDGYASNPDYARRTLESASGADVIVLCDTNGGTMPWELDAISQEIFSKTTKKMGIHVHNDSGFALINSIIALKNGAIQVQGTMNGLGERCGNLDWCEFLPVVQMKMGIDLRVDLKRLYEISVYVQRMTGMSLPKNKPFIGESAFSHKGGIHIDAMVKNPRMYEHVSPETVGNRRLLVLSEQVGRAGIVESARRHGYRLEKKDPLVLEVLRLIKERQNFTDAELFLLLSKKLERRKEPFNLLDYETKVSLKGKAKTEMKVRIGRETLHEISEGVGPVHSLDMALRKALSKFYAIEEVQLSNFRVRIINQEKATAAKVEVFIEFKANGNSWSTSYTSDDIIKASENALVKGYKYFLLKSGETVV